MPFVKIMVHCVWGTKNRMPVLLKERRELVINHIRQNAQTKDIHIDSINGHLEHLHALISLGRTQSISQVMQLIKGEVAYWINNQNNFAWRLDWADEYFAVSVSESQLQKVRDYINNQEEHHKKVTFQQEYDEFIKKYGFPLLG